VRHTDNTSAAIVLVAASNVNVADNASRADGTLLALISTSGGAVTHNSATGNPGSALYLCGASGVSIAHNGVDGSGAGLFVDGPADGCSPSTSLDVGHNEFERSGTFAIYVAQSSLSSAKIDHNRAEGSAADGIFVASGLNTLVHNRVSDSGRLDCRDVTTGSGTAGTANTWQHDQGATSSPPGICSRGEGEDNATSERDTSVPPVAAHDAGSKVASDVERRAVAGQISRARQELPQLAARY
jgi:hypothetical protein